MAYPRQRRTLRPNLAREGGSGALVPGGGAGCRVQERHGCRGMWRGREKGAAAQQGKGRWGGREGHVQGGAQRGEGRAAGVQRGKEMRGSDASTGGARVHAGEEQG
jgi:hypothetical protein